MPIAKQSIYLQVLHVLRDGKPHSVEETIDIVGKHIRPEQAAKVYLSSRKKRGTLVEDEDLTKTVALGKRSFILDTYSHARSSGTVKRSGDNYVITPKGIDYLIDCAPYRLELPNSAHPQTREIFNQLCQQAAQINYDSKHNRLLGIMVALRIIHRVVRSES